MKKFKCVTEYYQFILSFIFLIATVSLTSCGDEDPIKEDVPELITKVTLTFEPSGGGAIVIATATDPDGDGIQDIAVDGVINLQANTTYTLTLALVNELAEMSSPEYDITNEVEEEGDEHMFYYGWTGNVFSNPSGDGNIDNRGDAINYMDEDSNKLPIGLTTQWTTAASGSGNFRLILKHQPSLKTSTSDVNTGETDLDITFDISII